MDIPKIKTYTNVGLVGYEVIIEADQTSALPGIEIIGLPDAAIRESRERIRAVFKRIGIVFPPRKIILNLAPSDLKKTGTRFDFALAVALYLLLHPSQGECVEVCKEGIFLGELGLDGSLKRVAGLLPAVLDATKKGYTHFFIPLESKEEITCIPGIYIHCFTNFLQFVEVIQGVSELKTEVGSRKELNIGAFSTTLAYGQTHTKFEDIKGNEKAKRALVIAAAGGHNCILSGPPGTGKTMLAQSIEHILPPLSFEQTLEVSQIYSVVGKLSSVQPLITHRPFRKVHHTASKIALIGGGQSLMPGEISLAHHGVLFMDELPEFARDVLEVLRQPLEDGYITISRAQGTVQYPAKCLLVATMNPCICGFYKDEEHACICSMHEIRKYQARISGPLRERCDLMIEVPRQKVEVLLEGSASGTQEKYLELVQSAYEIQQKRYEKTSIYTNAYLTPHTLCTYAVCSEKAEGLLKEASKSVHLSARVTHKLLKVARTIADLEHSHIIQLHHMAEALQYRPKHFFIEQ